MIPVKAAVVVELFAARFTLVLLLRRVMRALKGNGKRELYNNDRIHRQSIENERTMCEP